MNPAGHWKSGARCSLRAMALLAAVSWFPTSFLLGQSPVRLTLQDMLSRIRADHPVNQQTQASINAAVARAASLSRLDNPSVQYEKVLLDRTWFLAQPIRWPWEFGPLRRLGVAQVQEARAAAQLDVQTVALAAAQRFADGIHSREVLGLAIDAESLAVLGLNRTTAARQMGQGGDLQVLQARVSLDAARRARVAASEESRAAAASVAILIGQPPDSALELVGSLRDLAPVSLPDSLLDSVAVTSDVELNRLSSQAERADREAKVARSKMIPEIQVGPTYGFIDAPCVPGIMCHPKFWGFIFEAGLPLFNTRGDAVRAANSEKDASIAAQRSRKRELAAQILEASALRSRAESALGALRSGDLTRAAQAESLAVAALQQGGAFLTTWLAIHEAYLDARRAELDLEWQAARARLTLRYLTGTLLTEPSAPAEQR